MKKKIILAVAVVTLLCGCGKVVPELKDGSEAVVTFKNGTSISANDLYKELKDKYATSIVIDMIDTKILEDKYKDSLDDAKEYASNYIKSLKNYYVDEDGKYDENALLNAVNQYYGYATIEEFEEGVRINYLRNKAVEDYTKTLVKDKDIEKYYKDEIVGDREVYHIQIIPEVKDTMTDDEKKAKENEALNKAKSLIAELKKGTKFETLAKENSDDESTKTKGGNLGFMNKGAYGSDEFDKEAFSLKVGSYSTTPVKTNSGYEIIYIKSEKDKKELKEVKDDIISKLVETKMSEDQTLQITGMTELRKEYGIDIIDSDVKANYNKYIDKLIASVKNSESTNK